MTKFLTIITSALMAVSMASTSLADTGRPTQAIETGETAQLPDPLQAGWNGEPVCENLFENDQNRILRCNFPPGGGTCGTFTDRISATRYPGPNAFNQCRWCT